MGDQLRFVDDSGDTRLAGELHDDGATVGDVLTVQADGSIAAAAGGGGLPDPITTAVTIAPTDPNANPLTLNPSGNDPALTIHGGPGSEVPGGNALINAFDHGNNYGASLSTQGLYLVGDGSGDILDVQDSTFADKLRISDTGIGFFGHAPAAQPAAPTDTASIIAALQALGLVGT